MGLPRLDDGMASTAHALEDLFASREKARVKPMKLKSASLCAADCQLFEGSDAFSIPTCEEEGTSNFEPQLREMLSQRSMDWSSLPPENDYGCIEYKWRLDPMQKRHRDKVERLATQMQFRLGEGSGTAYYMIGVRDSGSAPGLLPQEHAATVRVLMEAAAMVGSALVMEALSEARPSGRGAKEGGTRRCSVWSVGTRRAVQMAQVMSTLDLGGVNRNEGCREAAARLEGQEPIHSTHDRLGLVA